jgi:Transposase and inactivated derivatives, IS30 family
MMGKAHKSALLVITDRTTLLTRLTKVDTRKQMLSRIPKSFIKTLTVDNDKGFANHASIAKTLGGYIRTKGRLKTELA